MKNVTEEVSFGENDGEILPLTKCVCGAEWSNWMGPLLHIYEDTPTECPNCKRRFFFRNSIEVFEL